MSLLRLFSPSRAYYERDGILALRPWVQTGLRGSGMVPRQSHKLEKLVRFQPPLPAIPRFLRSAAEWDCSL